MIIMMMMTTMSLIDTMPRRQLRYAPANWLKAISGSDMALFPRAPIKIVLHVLSFSLSVPRYFTSTYHAYNRTVSNAGTECTLTRVCVRTHRRTMHMHTHAKHTSAHHRHRNYLPPVVRSASLSLSLIHTGTHTKDVTEEGLTRTVQPPTAQSPRRFPRAKSDRHHQTLTYLVVGPQH